MHSEIQEMKPYLTDVSDGYLRNDLMAHDQVNSKTITSDHQSRVNKTSDTMATTSTHDSDDISSDTSDITVYFDEEVFKEEEGTNELIEKVSKSLK
ncbi:unnamed protein product [Rhizophagus irregularis]|nr:unnamed protein product [Rhizophagus irregularis]